MNTTVFQELHSDFTPHPWYQALLVSPNVSAQPTVSRNPPYPNTTNAHSLFSSTLFNSTGLRAIQSFRVQSSLDPLIPTSHLSRRRPISGAQAKALGKPLEETILDEWLVVVSLGTGLNGPGGIVHGGIAMTLLDSAMAVRAARTAREKPVVTTRYLANFRSKIKAPCVVLCRAWLDERMMDEKQDEGAEKETDNGGDGKEQHGEIIHTKGLVEDGMGNVFLEATAQFAIRKSRAIAKL